MKNRIKQLFTIFGAIVVTSLFFSFKPKPGKIKYQYITIVARNHDLDIVTISIDGKDCITQNLARESKKDFDLNPIINLIHQYEDQGYELQNMNGTGVFHYFWLRKEKE